ncbi:MAG: uncharacterized ferritin-like protein (DUF455 family) [Gammaproteobacteria bacterium]|jgi:uncharacterized ferritin-like protein (DUF455 family)
MEANLYQRVEVALLEPDPQQKCGLVFAIFTEWQNSTLCRESNDVILPMDSPGQPELPRLVNPRDLKRRTTASEKGRICFLHAFAHIEFNAINIALDAVYRFRQMPSQYVSDWLLVASEEAKHFSLLDECLKTRGSFYGEHDAHRGLWDMVCQTRHDVLHRMGLVPRVMEARGLDVTPAMIEKFSQVNDQRAVEILEIIYRDEIGHVRIGNHWYQTLCSDQGLDSTETFSRLVDQYMNGKLRGPFNWPARLEAGFDEGELRIIEQTMS